MKLAAKMQMPTRTPTCQLQLPIANPIRAGTPRNRIRKDPNSRRATIGTVNFQTSASVLEGFAREVRDFKLELGGWGLHLASLARSALLDFKRFGGEVSGEMVLNEL